MEKNIKIAFDFTNKPGFRYRKDSDFSGQEFREEKLQPLFEDVRIKKIIIDLDGTVGYATSFLEEAFGGLSRIYGKEKTRTMLSFKSDEDPLLIEEIYTYIDEA